MTTAVAMSGGVDSSTVAGLLTENNSKAQADGAPRLVGHGAIRASWEAIFERGGVAIRPRQLLITQNLMTAVHNIVEEVNSSDNEHQELHIIATNIYLKTPQGWRIAVHHASVAPGAVVSEHSTGSMLH